MQEIKVSIIIPVYNAALYLERCLLSLQEQSFKELEIICVDDGSDDDSIRIIKEWQKTEERIQLLQQDHQYAGAARNYGLTEAKGKYVMFLDADDFFEKEMITDLYEQAEKKQADIVLCSGYQYNDRSGSRKKKKNWLRVKTIPSKLFSYRDIPDDIFYITNTVAWNKFYRRQFVLDNGLHFQAIHNANDLCFVMLSLVCAGRITYLNRTYVNYRINISDNIQTTKKEHPFDFLTALDGLGHSLMERGAFDTFRKSYAYLVQYVTYYNLRTSDRGLRKKILEKLNEYETLASMIQEETNKSDARDEIERFRNEIAFEERFHEPEVQASCVCKAKIKKPLCSVIVCMNADKTDKGFLNQLMEKIPENCEIVVVKALSDESCPDREDRRLTLIEAEDHGISYFRSLGLEQAEGEYLYFADTGIIPQECVLQTMLDHCEENDLEMLFCGTEPLRPMIMKATELVPELVSAKAYDSCLGKQIVKKDLIKKSGNRFAYGLSFEDELFTFRNLLKAQKAGYLQTDLLQNNDLASHACDYAELCSHFENYLAMRKIIQQQVNELPVDIQKLVYLEKEKIIRLCDQAPEFERPDMKTLEGWKGLVYDEEIGRELRSLKKKREQEKNLQEANRKQQELQERYDKMSDRLDKILSSRTYRFARMLSWLPHKLRKLFGTQKQDK